MGITGQFLKRYQQLRGRVDDQCDEVDADDVFAESQASQHRKTFPLIL